MSLPFEFNWGVKEAIRRLCPTASFTVEGLTITSWTEPNNLPQPAVEQIHLEMEKLHTEYTQK